MEQDYFQAFKCNKLEKEVELKAHQDLLTFQTDDRGDGYFNAASDETFWD